jgi:hypothetical protein
LRHDQRLRQLAPECAPMTSEAAGGAQIPSKIKAIAVESAWMLRHDFIDRPAPGRSFRVKGIQPGMTVLSRPDPGPFSLTGRPFLPRNRLLAGRFRPAMRFATRGPSLQALRAGPVGAGNLPAHRRARFLKTRT